MDSFLEWGARSLTIQSTREDASTILVSIYSMDALWLAPLNLLILDRFTDFGMEIMLYLRAL